ncbi:MAG: hypothetical protein JOY80_10730 [Candidatus Dormibacteraeota bacterium]|nr:hypothetical protein [Candidatus Dormibacteraeota bacterium]
MYQAIRVFWNLAAIGGAIAVGLLTRDAGLTAITFFGGLIVPRVLGLVPHGPRRFGWGPGACGPRGGGSWRLQRFESWHRQAHGEPGQPAGSSATTV